MDADRSSASGAAPPPSPIAALLALLDGLGATTAPVEVETLQAVQTLARAAKAADERKDARLQNSFSLQTALSADLQQISAAAAHDLREPLRQAETLVSQIAEDFGPGDPLAPPLAEAHDDLQLVSNRLRRLRERVAALAEFARIAATEAAWRKHSLTTVAEAAAQELAETLRSSGARLVIDPLPDVTGDGAQLQRLFVEIIRNAADHGGRPGVAIRIREAPPNDGWLCVSVVDDGIGVPSEHAERVFELFRRLRPKETPSGVGLGLPLCRRIMTVHGGRIRLEPPTGPAGAHLHLMFPSGGASPLGDQDMDT